MHLAYINYEIAKRNFELNVRLKDQAFEQIIAPPAAGGTQAWPSRPMRRPRPPTCLNFQGKLDRGDAVLDQRLAALPDEPT